jgi:hypothetical protein
MNTISNAVMSSVSESIWNSAEKSVGASVHGFVLLYTGDVVYINTMRYVGLAVVTPILRCKYITLSEIRKSLKSENN